MPEPSEELASDAERELLVEALRRHLGDGRITLEEFDERARRVYAAASRAQARDVLADLPQLEIADDHRHRVGRKRHGEQLSVQPHWVATGEVFRDPTTRRVMRVWVDPTDGSRHYREADGA